MQASVTEKLSQLETAPEIYRHLAMAAEGECLPSLSSQRHPLTSKRVPQRTKIMRLPTTVWGEVLEETFEEEEEMDGVDRGSTCVICDRSFKSKPALYGHMRSHPERQYRGMTPSPVGGGGISSSTSAYSPPLKWSTTRKRGRSNTKTHDLASSFHGGVDEVMEEAVFSLLLLANGGRDHHEIAHFYTDFCLKSGKIGVRKGLLLASEKPKKKTVIHDSDRKKKKKKKMIVAIETLDEKTTEHSCSICDKSFLTHQALGGHMASHKTAASPRKKAAAAALEHRCEKCGAVYLTGQALGGHKRKHWKRYESSSPVKSQEIPSRIRDTEKKA